MVGIDALHRHKPFDSAADSIIFFQPVWPLLFSFVASRSEVEFLGGRK